MKKISQLLILLVLLSNILLGQPFYVGADLSYVNEMEDCGVVYLDDSQPRDPFAIFADHGANLVRLRLWHTPAWYDTLNAGNRYSDFADVKRSIARVHAQGMQVLLDFHLSDSWADPGHQVVPAAWAAVVGNTPVLGDSLYQYVYGVLRELAEQGLWPEMVQLGNETNRGILQTQAANDGGWVLDWPRNATLFNRGLSAIRAAATDYQQEVQIGLHLAGLASMEWYVDQFTQHGVTDYNFIGISYYWAWHQPTTIAQTGDVISRLRQAHPNKEVLILETGYPWTLAWNDSAANIINDLSPAYSPASPEAQYQWLVDLSQEVRQSGGSGVLYWEPAWVSSPCWTPWGQGSHQEHAAFFDFNNNVLPTGGMAWLGADFGPTGVAQPGEGTTKLELTLSYQPASQQVQVALTEPLPAGNWHAVLFNVDGKGVQDWRELPTDTAAFTLDLPTLPNGVYFFTLFEGQVVRGSAAVGVVR